MTQPRESMAQQWHPFQTMFRPALPPPRLPADVYETAGGEAYVLEIPVPGLSAEDITIGLALPPARAAGTTRVPSVPVPRGDRHRRDSSDSAGRNSENPRPEGGREPPARHQGQPGGVRRCGTRLSRP